MIESMTPSMYIKQDFSAEISAWVEQGNQIKVLGRGESTHNKAFNNREKKTPQDAMKKIMAASVQQQRKKKEPKPKPARDYASEMQIAELADWLDAKKGRASKVVKLLDTHDQFLSAIKLCVRPCTKEQYNQIVKAMKTIEQGEAA